MKLWARKIGFFYADAKARNFFHPQNFRSFPPKLPVASLAAASSFLYIHNVLNVEKKNRIEKNEKKSPSTLSYTLLLCWLLFCTFCTTSNSRVYWIHLSVRHSCTFPPCISLLFFFDFFAMAILFVSWGKVFGFRLHRRRRIVQVSSILTLSLSFICSS